MKENWEHMPLFKKALKINDIVKHIINAVESTEFDFENEIESEMLKHNLDYLHKNAMIIPAKIAGASGKDMLYDIKMENATIIRKSARELLTDIQGIEMYGYKDFEYLDILRTEIEEFRILFAQWIQTFDTWNYSIDRWGLFNPPGINFDDHDPDDDLPLSNNDFFEN